MNLKTALLACLLPAATCPAGTLGGKLLDQATGLPISGAKIFITEVKTQSRNPVRDSALTGAEGDFLFLDLPAITEISAGFNLRSSAPGYRVVSTPLIQVAAAEDKRLDLKALKLIEFSILIVDTGDGRVPLRARTVLQGPESGSPEFSEADTGGYVRFRDRVAGKQEITLALDGYRTRYLERALSGTVFRETLFVAMARDTAGDSRIVEGTAAAGSTVYPGLTIAFRCGSGASGILFAYCGAQGGFAISGIPAACGEGTLFSGYGDSTHVALTGGRTVADVKLTRVILGLPRLHEKARPYSGKKRPWRDRNALGRRIFTLPK